MRGRAWVGIFVGCCCASAWSLAAPGAGPAAPKAAAARALDKPAFTATPAELLALGKAASAGDASIVVLRAQREVSYDDAGRATVRARRVYVVKSHDADDLDDAMYAIRADWHPSFQNRPVIRARVIGPAGNAVDLDPALVTERPAQSRPGTAPGDTRYLDARLPPVEVDAVVEQEVATTDREPPIAGSVDITPLHDSAPTSSTVISYSAPASARVHLVARKLPAGVRVQHQVAHGREIWSYEIGPSLAFAGAQDRDDDRFADRFELDAPVDAVVSPYVGVGTAASWEAVARGYGKLVDRRISEGPFALPAELPRGASDDAIRAIVAWVHQHVRCTSPVHGERIATPLTPADAVKQATGSCSDKATLAVALLRQAGITADLVLFESAWGHHVDAELPGGTAFNRALVCARIAARDVWIDPAEELARPGQLPDGAQGRRALVIADATKALSLTPVAAPADNVVRDVRTFVAPEYGPSQLTRIVRYTGILEIEQRRWARGAHGDARKKQLGPRSEALFGGTLDQVTSTDPADLTAPFEVTMAVENALRVSAEREEIDIYLYPHAAFDHLPWVLTAEREIPRHHDYVWSRPQIAEVENRIVVPTGFNLPAPVPERTRQIGTATFTERRQIDGRTLIVAFRLDTGKLRLTPAELTALRAGLKEIDEEVHIKLEQTAFALGYAGKPREAIAECQRLIALHPAEALHHSQLSTVLLRAGAGEAARREARKAVAMAPGDVEPLVVLGWTLGFDTLGRQYTYDWDRAGAIAALQQARKLAPKHFGALVALAQALQRDPAGRMFEHADLAGAAEAWRAAQAIDKTDDNTLALAQVLLWSRQFAESEKVARTATASEERDKWIVAAVAGGAGGAAAIKAAGDLRSGTSRTQLLASAAWVLMTLQQYDAARELLTESGALARMPAAVATVLNKVKKQPPLASKASDPRYAVFELMATLFDAERKTTVFWDAELERDFRGVAARFVPVAVRAFGTAGWFDDVLQSMAVVEVEGDAGAWRTSVEADGKRFQAYFVLERGALKVIGSNDMVASVGRYILRASDAKAGARARKLLDWVRADNDAAPIPAPPAFKRLWGPGVPPSHDAIMLAAAALTGTTDPDRVIAVTSSCASTVPDAELACHEVRFLAHYARERWSDAVTEGEAIVALRPDLAAARAQLHAWALARAGRFDDADRLLDGVLAKDPNHHGARIGRFDVASMRGADAETARRADAVVNHAAASAWDLNYVAWQRLGTTGDLGAALELARKAVDRAPREGGVMNTLAALEAEAGELGRAIDDNRKAMALRNTTEPTADDWYVAGRIAEQLGLTADAIAAYKRVTRPRGDLLVSAYGLAQRRLAALGRAH